MQVCPNSACRFPDCTGEPAHHPDTAKIPTSRIIASACRVITDRRFLPETHAVEQSGCAAMDFRAPVLSTGFSWQRPILRILERQHGSPVMRCGLRRKRSSLIAPDNGPTAHPPLGNRGPPESYCTRRVRPSRRAIVQAASEWQRITHLCEMVAPMAGDGRHVTNAAMRSTRSLRTLSMAVRTDFPGPIVLHPGSCASLRDATCPGRMGLLQPVIGAPS